MTPVALIGAGGHARALLEMLPLLGLRIEVYVDPKRSEWIDAQRLENEEALATFDQTLAIVLGFGAVDPADLARRSGVFERVLSTGREAPPLIHPTAIVSASARVGIGSQVMAGAIIQPGVSIGPAAIVNTGAIVEHGSVVEGGAHIAPGAVVLADCMIGRDAMIGAGSVILPGQQVAAGVLVRAATRYPK